VIGPIISSASFFTIVSEDGSPVLSNVELLLSVLSNAAMPLPCTEDVPRKNY